MISKCIFQNLGRGWAILFVSIFFLNENTQISLIQNLVIGNKKNIGGRRVALLIESANTDPT